MEELYLVLRVSEDNQEAEIIDLAGQTVFNFESATSFKQDLDTFAGLNDKKYLIAKLSFLD